MPGSETYEQFKAVHTRDGGLVMPNAWVGHHAASALAAGDLSSATAGIDVGRVSELLARGTN